MNVRLLESLVCPICHRQLEPICFNSPADCLQSVRTPDGELFCGVLRCKCGKLYPVIEGVPRLLVGGIDAFPEFRSRHQINLGRLNNFKQAQASAPRTRDEDDYDNIRRSFSQEWGIFNYNSDKTWGWTLAERKKVFLGDVAMKPEELSGKRLLDAGCGNGTMTAALSDFDLDIVGLDLNDGLGLAYKNRDMYSPTASAHVQFVQGNLIDPPLKESSFELIYSSGVIHHTPSSKRAFDSLVRLARPGGRLYVWVYGKRGVLVRLFFWWGRSLKNWMSLKSVLRVCRALAPAYKVAAETLSLAGLMQFRPRTTREITLDLFDAFAPKYNHWHTESEVRSWFKQHGFRNIHVSGVQKHGFGMYGDKG